MTPRVLRSTLAFVVWSASAAWAAAPAWADDPPWCQRSKTGMVAADAPEASRAGAAVLARGGNAFDAAIATSLALAVVRPESTGLGGGGFMVAYLAHEKRIIVLDFREVAPAGATREHYEKAIAAAGDGPPPTIYGGLAVGVPGQLAGLRELQRRFATMPFSELAQPAIQLARDGFTIDAHYVSSCKEVLADAEKWPALREKYRPAWSTLLGAGKPPAVGSKLPRPDLARTIALLAREGPEAFYRGPLAAAIVRSVRAHGGVLAASDLEAYQVREREPIRVAYGDGEVVTMPPPSSGGICIAQTLNILRATALRADLDPVRSRQHVLIEALKHAFADRSRWLGDPDFASLPLARLVSREYAAALSGRILPDGILDPGAYGTSASGSPGTATQPTDRGTSHFCVADRFGNVVAMTETVNGTFGSLILVEPYGILLNNQIDDFAGQPGKPNLYGLIQGAANVIAPGKRPLSSMSPTIVLRDGRPVLALGASGGPRIITSVLQVLLHVLDDGRPLGDALAAPRLHHQWLPDEVRFDRPPSPELKALLESHGHRLGATPAVGVVQAIQILPDGMMIGVSDPRKGGVPAGLAALPLAP